MVTSTGSQAYCLKLNSHQNHLIEAFQRLYEDKTMVDCTLSCQGGAIKAHKLVLSACSPYFTEMFSSFSNPYQYPIVILKDMSYTDLVAILEFMYKGEVTVSQRNLPTVLDSAKALMVTGLCDIEVDNFETGTRSSVSPPRTPVGKKRRATKIAGSVASAVKSTAREEESISAHSDEEKSENESPEKQARKDTESGEQQMEEEMESGQKVVDMAEETVTGKKSEPSPVRGDEISVMESGDSNASLPALPGPSTRLSRSASKLSPSAAFKAGLRQKRIEKLQPITGGISGRKMWSEDETRALVKVWEEESARVWASAGKKVLSLQRISELLQNENVERDISQVEGKIKALKRDFKAIKLSKAIPAVQARMAPYLDKLEAIYSREEL